MGKYKNELLNLPEEKMFNSDLPLMDFIYLIPERRLHDSGYHYITIVCGNIEGYKKILSYSDVVDIERIFDTREHFYKISMDVPDCGVIRLFSHSYRFKINHYGISTFSFNLVERDN